MVHTDEFYLVNHFHEALSNGHIKAYFQPIYRSYTGNILCAESLARWVDPESGMLSPDTFIPVLEQNNLICELDMEILSQACALYKELSLRGMPLNAFSVNLSREDFKDEKLFEKITGILESYEVPHEAIKLEITESHMLEDTETFQKVFKKFTDAGFNVWLDDFGSGYSSLNMLQNYSFDVIKFDMLFLRNLSVKGRELLASLINMAKTLGIHTLTEGVETEEQQEFLQALGCEAQQGFFYSQPLSREALITFLETHAGIPESGEDKTYWNKIGRLNFLSPNPLKEFSEGKDIGSEIDNKYSAFDNSIALLECSQTQFRYVYATNGYIEQVRGLGFDSLTGLQQAFANQRSHQFLLVRKLILDAIERGTVQTVEYANKDVYYRLRIQLLSRKKGWVMLAVHLNTFDSEREVKTAREMLNFSSALLTTYDLVVLIFPDSNKSTRLYTSNKLPIYDREGSITGSVEKFCEREVDPADQRRYLQFMNFQTMEKRLEVSPQKFIQSYFRMRWGNDSENWHTARVTQIPKYPERTYLLTIQSIQGNGNKLLNTIAKEHPDLLENIIL
ncbi:MAG: EAL domain-containing protein [Anaerolineaceae bacterium]|nr:EAL domain-containing protein [Anaerolineaceae bacterium]